MSPRRITRDAPLLYPVPRYRTRQDAALLDGSKVNGPDRIMATVVGLLQTHHLACVYDGRTLIVAAFPDNLGFAIGDAVCCTRLPGAWQYWTKYRTPEEVICDSYLWGAASYTYSINDDYNYKGTYVYRRASLEDQWETLDHTVIGELGDAGSPTGAWKSAVTGCSIYAPVYHENWWDEGRPLSRIVHRYTVDQGVTWLDHDLYDKLDTTNNYVVAASEGIILVAAVNEEAYLDNPAIDVWRLDTRTGLMAKVLTVYGSVAQEPGHGVNWAQGLGITIRHNTAYFVQTHPHYPPRETHWRIWRSDDKGLTWSQVHDGVVVAPNYSEWLISDNIRRCDQSGDGADLYIGIQALVTGGSRPGLRIYNCSSDTFDDYCPNWFINDIYRRPDLNYLIILRGSTDRGVYILDLDNRIIDNTLNAELASLDPLNYNPVNIQYWKQHWIVGCSKITAPYGTYQYTFYLDGASWVDITPAADGTYLTASNWVYARRHDGDPTNGFLDPTLM